MNNPKKLTRKPRIISLFLRFKKVLKDHAGLEVVHGNSIEINSVLKQFELEGDFTSRLAMMEEIKTLPFGAVWDYYCESQNTAVGRKWLEDIKTYEKTELVKRS